MKQNQDLKFILSEEKEEKTMDYFGKPHVEWVDFTGMDEKLMTKKEIQVKQAKDALFKALTQED